MLITNYSLLITHYSLLITHYLLFLIISINFLKRLFSGTPTGVDRDELPPRKPEEPLELNVTLQDYWGFMEAVSGVVNKPGHLYCERENLRLKFKTVSDPDPDPDNPYVLVVTYSAYDESKQMEPLETSKGNLIRYIGYLVSENQGVTPAYPGYGLRIEQSDITTEQ